MYESDFKIFFIKLVCMQYLWLGHTLEWGIYKFTAGKTGIHNTLMGAENLLSKCYLGCALAVGAAFFYIF